jgi:hypothetical protein
MEEARFDQSPMRDSRSVRVMPAVEFQPLALIAGRASIGYESFQPLDRLFPRFDGVVGDADMSVPIPGTARLQLGATRDVEYSYQLTEPLYLLSAARASIVRRVGTRWEVEGGAARQRLAYRTLGSAGEAVRTSRIDRRMVYHATISYRVGPLLRVGIRSEYARRRSDLPDHQFERMQAGAFIRYGLPQ